MKPAAFDYVGATSADEALAALARGGDDARVLAGGQSLMAMMNFRLVEPSILVDITGIDGMDYVRTDGGKVEIGAATRQRTLENWSGLQASLPLLAKAIPNIGHFQTRSRGTVCGSIAHADPSSELPLCLATLGGEVVLRSAKGERVLSAADFQTGMLSTAKRADEIVAAACYPVQDPKSGSAFAEMTQRRGDFAIVAVAAVATGETIRLGVGGVADKPAVRQWDGLADGDIDDALNEFAWEMGGVDDPHASARYRRELVRRLGRRVIEEAKSWRS